MRKNLLNFDQNHLYRVLHVFSSALLVLKTMKVAENMRTCICLELSPLLVLSSQLNLQENFSITLGTAGISKYFQFQLTLKYKTSEKAGDSENPQSNRRFSYNYSNLVFPLPCLDSDKDPVTLSFKVPGDNGAKNTFLQSL